MPLRKILKPDGVPTKYLPSSVNVNKVSENDGHSDVTTFDEINFNPTDSCPTEFCEITIKDELNLPNDDVIPTRRQIKRKRPNSSSDVTKSKHSKNLNENHVQLPVQVTSSSEIPRTSIFPVSGVESFFSNAPSDVTNNCSDPVSEIRSLIGYRPRDTKYSKTKVVEAKVVDPIKMCSKDSRPLTKSEATSNMTGKI